MHIALINSVLSNGGDAAIQLGTLRVLRSAFGPETTFAIYDAAPETARAHYPDLDIRPALRTLAFDPKPRNAFAKKARFARWAVNRPRFYAAAALRERGMTNVADRLLSEAEREQVEALAAADLVCSVGGTYLVENYWLGPMLFDFGVVRRLGLPLVLLTQSMGPFRKPHVRRSIRQIVEDAGLVLLRDEASRQNVEAIGAEGARVRVGADLAFALADAETLKTAQTETWPDRPRVAVSVREWPYFETMPVEEGMAHYRASIAATVEHLVRAHDAEVFFVSTCQGNPEYRYDDSAVAAAIVATLPDDVRGRVSVDAEYHRPEALLDLLGGFDLTIATRMHVAILSLSAGVPVLPIAYEFKTQALFDRLGLGAWVQDIERVRSDTLPGVTDRFIDDLPTFRADLFERVEEQRAEAFASGEWVRDAVREGRR
jgi:colanic acid/amylovoran biosynthesis protein